MRVALSIPNLLSYHTFLRELVSELANRGHEPAVFTDLSSIFHAQEYSLDPRCQFFNVPFPRGANILSHLRAALKLKEMVRQFNPNLLHVHFSATAFTVALARRSLRCPVIGTIQGLISPQVSGLQRFNMTFAERFAYRRLDLVWVLTGDDFSELKRLIPEARARQQKALGFGCRLDAFDPGKFSEAYRSNQRLKFNIAPNDVVFCFVGRRTHFKGFHLVVRAFLSLVAQGFKAKLILIGGYDPLHSCGLSESEMLSLKESKHVIDVGWRGDVENFLAICDVNVFPSIREGVPVNLMESLAIGVPAITVNSRGCRDVVRHEVDGIVIEKPSESELTDAMRSLIVDSAKRKRFSKRALADRIRLDRNSWIQEQIAIYEQVLVS